MVRNNSIDIAKGIGIFLVIWAHTVCPIIPQIAIFHMPLFFMMSGFVFSNRDGFGIVLGKKIKTLLIPFFIFFVFQRIGFILISVIGGTFEKPYLLPWTVIPPWRVMGVLWFLVALFMVTMMYSLISYIKNDLIKLLITLALTLTGYMVYVYKIDLPLHLGSSLSMMFFFCLGSMLSKTGITSKGGLRIWLVAGLLSVALYLLAVKLYLPAISVANNTMDGNFELIVLYMALGCLMVLSVSKLLDFIPGVSNALAYTGRNSLSIYVVHTVILESVYLAFPKNTLSFTAGFVISLFILFTGLGINILLQKYFPFALGKQDLIPGKWMLGSLTAKKP
jgi:fucose 4-O-acetylase-like acetyltransferase